MRLPVLFILCLFTAAISAQVADSTDRWFFEGYNKLTQPRLLEGEDFTEARYSISSGSRAMYRLVAGAGLSVAGGIGIGFRELRQRSTADLYQCQLGPQPASCAGSVTDWVDVEHNSAYVELPVQLRYLPGRNGTGLYVTLGTTAQWHFLQSVESVRRQQRNDAGFVLAQEEVRNRIAHLFFTGIGYQQRSSPRQAWYVEIVYGWSTNAVVSGHPDRDPFRVRYFQNAGVRQLGLTAGLNL